VSSKYSTLIADLLEPAVEERVVHGFAIIQQHYSENPSARLLDPPPAANPTVRLHLLVQRLSDDSLDPLEEDLAAIRSLAIALEV
jgi:hypothetical protein